MIQDFESICGQKAFTPHLLDRCLTVDETQFSPRWWPVVYRHWLKLPCGPLPWCLICPTSASPFALCFGSSLFHIFLPVPSQDDLHSYSGDNQRIAPTGYSWRVVSGYYCRWRRGSLNMINCARPSFQTFEDKNLILKAKAISRNYNIKVVIILMVLLLNQVPLPDVQQAKCQDAGVCSREKIYSWGSQVSRPENKTQIHLPEDRV